MKAGGFGLGGDARLGAAGFVFRRASRSEGRGAGDIANAGEEVCAAKAHYCKEYKGQFVAIDVFGELDVVLIEERCFGSASPRPSVDWAAEWTGH